MESGHQVCVCSSVPEGIFRRELPDLAMFRDVELDSGAVQRGPMAVDARATLECYRDLIHHHHEDLVHQEETFIKKNAFHLVLSDATPLCVAAAWRAGVKSAVITNFSWDHIYQDLLDRLQQRRDDERRGSGRGGPPLTAEEAGEFQEMIDQIVEDYGCADTLLRLPGFHNMTAFKKVVDVPLVVRRPQKTGWEVRDALGIPQSAHVALLTFGGHRHIGSTQPDLRDDLLPEGWLCLVLGGTTNGAPLQALEDGRFLLVGKDVYVPDLVNAADVVIGKLGYGTAAEMLCCNKPSVHVSHSNWAEEQHLVDMLNEFGVTVKIPKETFAEGNWAPYLKRAEQLHLRSEKRFHRSCEGGKIITSIVEEMAGIKSGV